MRAVVHDGSGGALVREVEDPSVSAPTDAVVRVTRAGVCGTDLHVLAHPDQLRPGVILGHEYIGRVEDVGAAVTSVRRGDLVVGGDYVACGHCRWCRTGDHWHCAERRFHGTGELFGPELDGAQADRVRVPFADTSLRLLPAELEDDSAVLLGDVLATAVAAAERLSILPGECVLVVGGGPVGQLAATAAQLAGAGQVVVVEPVEGRREIAKRAGSHAVAPDGAKSLLGRLTAGRGADAAIDAVGGSTGLDFSIAQVRAAGRVVSVGVPAEPKWDMSVADAFARELRISFAVGNFLRDAERLFDVLTSGLVVPPGLFGERFSLADASSAYHQLRTRRTLKVILDT